VILQLLVIVALLVYSVDLGGCLDTLKHLIDKKRSGFTVTDNKGHTPVHLMIT